MRQLLAIVPRGAGVDAARLAEEHNARNIVELAVGTPAGERDLVVVHVPNARVDALIASLQELDGVHVTLTPQGVMTLYPPAGEAPEQVTDVTMRSPLEIFLSGLQSIGSWSGFLGYAAAAGGVVWIAMHTDTIFLLIAAMLIAPFAGPAMTLAMGTARGDRIVIGRSLLRYFASLGVTIGVALLLSMVVGQQIASELMIDTSQVSAVTVLLPLIAGAAGALNLAQSERSSLVTAAGPGVLVAASLAPPAGLIGMSLAIREWDLAVSGIFVLLLQLAGINLAGAATFWFFGLRPQGARYARGQGIFRLASLVTSIVALALLLAWQFASPPDLQRATQAQRAAHQVQQIIEASGSALPVEVNVRFTRADIRDQNTLLVVAWVQRAGDAADDPAEISSQLSRLIGEQLATEFDVTPVVDVTVLDGH